MEPVGSHWRGRTKPRCAELFGILMYAVERDFIAIYSLVPIRTFPDYM